VTDRGAGLAVLPVLDLEGDGGAALGGEASNPPNRTPNTHTRARTGLRCTRGAGSTSTSLSRRQPHSVRATGAEGREGKEGCSRESTAPHPVSLLRDPKHTHTRTHWTPVHTWGRFNKYISVAARATRQARGVGGRARGRSSQPHSVRATGAEGREGKEGCSRERGEANAPPFERRPQRPAVLSRPSRSHARTHVKRESEREEQSASQRAGNGGRG
jgi:hypothetical protein